MLHACFTPIALCFVYTSWYFYAFSGTNLLTRCHSVSFLFSVVFVFQKIYTKIILRIRRNESRSSYLPYTKTEFKGETEGARGQPHYRVTRATPWPRHQVVWTPGPPPDIALPPINSLWWENPKGTDIFHETYCKPPPSSRDREGPEALPDTLSEKGIITGGLLHHHASLRSDAWIVYLKL
jgi:hypothetical protein